MIQGEEYIMTLLSYQVFMAVVEQESFQKAAQVLQLTPSAIMSRSAGMEQSWDFRCLSVASRAYILQIMERNCFPT